MEKLSQIENICRICEKETNFIDLSHPNNQSFVDQFVSCANVTFKIDDGLPKYLCRFCATQLKHFYYFKEKCENSQEKFKKLLASANIDYLTKLLNDINNDDESVNSIDETNDEHFNQDEINIDIASFDPNELNEYLCSDSSSNDKKTQLSTVSKKSKTALNNGIKKSKDFICDICQRRYDTKAGIRIHFSLKHNERKANYYGKEIKCEICSMIFLNDPNYLARHIMFVHEKYKPFECEFCKKHFAHKTALETHVAHLHSTRYDFNCHICGRLFKTRIGLKAHIKSHTDEKPHECEFCQKKFSRADNLRTHRRLHTGEKPFKCEKCTECFIDLNGLKRHRRRMHANE